MWAANSVLLSAVWWNISSVLCNRCCETRTLFKWGSEAESTFRPLSCQLVSVLSDYLGHINSICLLFSPAFVFFFFQISLTNLGVCLQPVWMSDCLFLSLLDTFFQSPEINFITKSRSIRRKTLFFFFVYLGICQPPCSSFLSSVESLTAYFKLRKATKQTHE